LNGFLDKHKFVLLTCRAPDGSLHARTMAIADKTKDMKVRFIYDRDSYKETEIDNEYVSCSVFATGADNQRTRQHRCRR
jgi:general stress protein 26